MDLQLLVRWERTLLFLVRWERTLLFLVRWERTLLSGALGTHPTFLVRWERTLLKKRNLNLKIAYLYFPQNPTYYLTDTKQVNK